MFLDDWICLFKEVEGKKQERWICNGLLIQGSQVIWGVSTSVLYLSLQSGPRHFYEQGTLCWGMYWSIRPQSEDNNMPYRVTQTQRARLVLLFPPKYTNNVVWMVVLLWGKHCLNIEYCFESLDHLERSFNIAIEWRVHCAHTKIKSCIFRKHPHTIQCQGCCMHECSKYEVGFLFFWLSADEWSTREWKMCLHWRDSCHKSSLGTRNAQSSISFRTGHSWGNHVAQVLFTEETRDLSPNSQK